MAHLYWIVINTHDDSGDGEVVNWLLNNSLISDCKMVDSNPNSSEKTMEVTVANRDKFLRYMNKKTREETDPRDLIVNFQYINEIGEPAPRGAAGMLRAARIRNAKNDKKQIKKEEMISKALERIKKKGFKKKCISG